MSSWICDEEESQERIRRSHTRQRQERNGEAAHGQVRKNSGTESRSLRIPEQPSTTMSGTVYKIISSRRPSQPEKAQIAVDGANHWLRDLRIENTLTDEHGDDVRLKKGAHVEVTITAKDINRHN
jgi:hypothetical protein